MYERFHVNYPYSYQVLIKLEFSRQSFVKYSNIEFHENPSSGSRVIPCGHMNAHKEANRHICNLVIAPKNKEKPASPIHESCKKPPD